HRTGKADQQVGVVLLSRSDFIGCAPKALFKKTVDARRNRRRGGRWGRGSRIAAKPGGSRLQHREPAVFNRVAPLPLTHHVLHLFHCLTPVRLVLPKSSELAVELRDSFSLARQSREDRLKRFEGQRVESSLVAPEKTQRSQSETLEDGKPGAGGYRRSDVRRSAIQGNTRALLFSGRHGRRAHRRRRRGLGYRLTDFSCQVRGELAGRGHDARIWGAWARRNRNRPQLSYLAAAGFAAGFESSSASSSAKRRIARARAITMGPRNIPMNPKAASPPRTPKNTGSVSI